MTTTGTVRSVAEVEGDGYLVAVRWDDGTLSEDVWDECPEVDDRVTRDD